MTRLYADTTMSVSEIARTFGVAESSAYRVAQRHGAALRGRQTPPGVPPPKPAATGAHGRPGTRAAANEASAETERRLSGARTRSRVTGATLGRFRIRFLAERVVQAGDIRDALR
jgi:transposase-like protein